jgi:hypothetical protein
MQFEGAVVREQGVTFAIVVVKRHVLDNTSVADATIRGFWPAFPGMSIVLMGQDSRGRATYYGRPDITRFLSGVPTSTIPWRRYTLD